MLHLTKSFLPCVSLSTVLALGACGGEPEPFGQTARFSQASEDEILAALMVVELAQFAALGMPFIALLDASFSDDGCPQITETGVVGNGCVGSTGTRYDGSFEFLQPGGDGYPSVIYREFRYSDDDFSFYMDGSLVFEEQSDDTVRYDLDMAMEVRYEPDATLERAEARMSAICDVLNDDAADCALEPGSVARVDGLGGFTLAGVHRIGFAGDEQSDENTSEVRFQGADSLYYEYIGATDCYTYTIDGREPQHSCDE